MVFPPEKNGDYAFLLHILASLKSSGTAAVVLPHGVLFRGGAEATIRKEVVRRGYIKAIKALFEKVLTKYSKLSADDVKSLVVEDKWLATLAATVQGELDRVSQSLTSRVKTLGERYGNKLPTLEADVETASAKVAAHLKKMGITW